MVSIVLRSLYTGISTDRVTVAGSSGVSSRGFAARVKVREGAMGGRPTRSDGDAAVSDSESMLTGRFSMDRSEDGGRISSPIRVASAGPREEVYVPRENVGWWKNHSSRTVGKCSARATGPGARSGLPDQAP